MIPHNRNVTIVFSLVVVFCLALVGWWVVFHIQEGHRLKQLHGLLNAEQAEAAAKIYEAGEQESLVEVADQRRLMFTSEGMAMGLLIVSGVFMLYRAILREQRLRQEQDRFLTGATHHLKTPLATIRLGIESLLAGSMPEEKKRRYLESMIRDADHLEKDLTNLLTAGGLKTTDHAIRLVTGNLAQDILTCLESMQARCQAANISLETGRLPATTVRRDREAMHLIMHNILDNAIKYTPAGGKVKVDLQQNNNMATITIRDNGAGIAAEDLPRIFDRYYRGSQKDHLGGTGIGLYLVQELIASHGGQIQVTSPGPGMGSCFTLNIPLEGHQA